MSLDPEHWCVPEDRHASNDGVGVVLCSRVDGIVSSDDQGQVTVVEVVINLLHLQHYNRMLKSLILLVTRNTRTNRKES